MAAGGPEKAVTDDRIIRAMEQTDYPFITTAMLQDITGYSDQWVRERLEKLEKDGRIEREKVGRHWVYWLPDYNYAGSR